MHSLRILPALLLALTAGVLGAQTVDTTPPSVPTGLAGTTVSPTQIDLRWSASSDNVGVASYRIYRGGTFCGTSATTFYSDTTATPTTSYSYTVVACDAAENASSPSDAFAIATGHAYYVAPGGQDDNPGNLSSPWETWEKAVATAEAGDTVYFKAGTYTVSTAPVTAHAGTVSAPIVLKAYAGESPIIIGSGLKALVFVRKPCWSFEGLSFEASNIPDRDSAIIRVGDNHADHTTIRDCRFKGVSAEGHDNIACIQVNAAYAHYALIQNNLIEGCHDVAGSGICGIQFLGIPGSIGVKILNNTIHGSSLGIYFKHCNGDTSLSTGAEIAYNHFYDCTKYAISGNPVYVNIHDNLFAGEGVDRGDGRKDCALFLGLNAGGIPMGNHNIVNHNTFYKTGLYQDNSAGCITYTNVTNNIFMALTVPAASRDSSAPHYTTLDYNLYIPDTALAEYGQGYTLDEWIAHYGGDAHSIAGIPTFVGGGNPSSLSDFALANGSLGRNAAADGTDLGANLALVGPQDPVTFNHPPVLSTIGNRSVQAGQEIQFTVEASDADGDARNYSATALQIEDTTFPTQD